MTYKEKAQDIYNMMSQGKLLDAFDKYYHENVTMVDGQGKREGKATCRQYEEKFLDSIAEFHGMEVQNIASDEDKGVVFVENSMDVTFKGGDRTTMAQVSVQQWDGDHIKHEVFYAKPS